MADPVVGHGGKPNWPTATRLALIAAQTVDADLSANIGGGDAAADALRVRTLGGDDGITIASNLDDLIGLAFDLGVDD